MRAKSPRADPMERSINARWHGDLRYTAVRPYRNFRRFVSVPSAPVRFLQTLTVSSGDCRGRRRKCEIFG
jgi:hypothetical protein